MAGRAASLCDDGGHPLPVQPHSHGRGQLPGHKDAARWKPAQIRLPAAQQCPQQALQVLDVRRPKTHPLILQSLKQPDIPAKIRRPPPPQQFSRPDGLIQLGSSSGVLEHGDLAGEDGTRSPLSGSASAPPGRGLPLHPDRTPPKAGRLALPRRYILFRCGPAPPLRSPDRRAHPTPKAPIPAGSWWLISLLAVLPTPRSPGTGSGAAASSRAARSPRSGADQFDLAPCRIYRRTGCSKYFPIDPPPLRENGHLTGCLPMALTRSWAGPLEPLGMRHGHVLDTMLPTPLLPHTAAYRS